MGLWVLIVGPLVLKIGFDESYGVLLKLQIFQVCVNYKQGYMIVTIIVATKKKDPLSGA